MKDVWDFVFLQSYAWVWNYSLQSYLLVHNRPPRSLLPFGSVPALWWRCLHSGCYDQPTENNTITVFVAFYSKNMDQEKGFADTESCISNVSCTIGWSSQMSSHSGACKHFMLTRKLDDNRSYNVSNPKASYIIHVLFTLSTITGLSKEWWAKRVYTSFGISGINLGDHKQRTFDFIIWKAITCLVLIIIH